MGDWDYIVIGAGSAGCALTHELVRSGRSVLLLEAGGHDRSLSIKVPALVGQAAAHHNWGYRSQPDPSRNGAVESWLRGRVLGGSSSINGMIYVRGAASDFDKWAERCGHTGGWSWHEVMPLFRELENSDQYGQSRGQSGPLHVRTVAHAHPVTEAFLSSVQAAGHPLNEDHNGASQEGFGYIQLSQRRGLRCSAADAFLRPLRRRKNLQLLLNASVRRIEFAGGRATAVEFTYGGKILREAAQDIVLCAGVIDSPKLLMLSGIGDREELSRLGIDVRLHLPGVGRNLKEHAVMRLVYRSKVPTHNLTEGFSQKLAVAAQFALYRQGPTATPFEAIGFLKTAATVRHPDLQLIFSPIGTFGRMGVSFGLLPYPSFKVYILRSHPLSSGRVRLASRDPQAHPLIECRMLEKEADVDTLCRGIETVRGIMRHEPMASLIDEEIAPGAAVQRGPLLSEFIREHVETAFHPIGTCRMGLDTDAVVSPDLRVRGAENLWVADTSIAPDHLSANMNAPAMMIGKKLGKQLAARR